MSAHSQGGMTCPPDPKPSSEDVHAVACEVMKAKNTIPYHDAQRVAEAAVVLALRRVRKDGNAKR